MEPLEKSLRTQLEQTVKEAREVAETAARVALEQLGVGEAAPFDYLSENQKDLRRKLRIHGRQLGDERDSTTETQRIDRLKEEVAYQHWHRMLFARFLAENNLLMYPDPEDPVAVTLEECEDLAADEGAANGWELAARFAAGMLPQIFRLESPVFQLVLPPEYQQKLERLVGNLPLAVFTASDSLGWVYQYWQANQKERINKSEVKIGARELPAVTQLFTEPYMVSFLLDNALGAWWAIRRLKPEDWRTAQSEAELRQKAAIPGVPLSYLRFTSPLNPLSIAGEGTLNREGQESVTSGQFVSAEKLELARQFRKEPTPKEAEVWEWLRNRKMLGLKWRRQQVIEGFIADFYCAEHHLALEIDGATHNTAEAQEYDRIRDNIFAQKGIKTLRISNQDCTQQHLQTQIQNTISPPSSSSPLTIHGEGGQGGEVAAGTFDTWPDRLGDLKILDPCCGSGHFLVAALLMLVPLRMELEGLSAQEAVDAVLRQNLHGLELDQRCVALAAFALAFTAWTYPGAGGYRSLPELNIACSGLSVSVAKEEWKQLGLGKRNLTLAMDWLHNIFQDAPVLGSLLNPANTPAVKLVKWEELSGALAQALEQEPDTEQQEVAVVAQGLAKAAMLLAGQYHWVITNVPYLARGKQSDKLREFCAEQYKEAKNDLATVFLERCLELCSPGGTSSIVLPQNWLFLTSYKAFREKLLKQHTWQLIARLGPQAFQTPMWDFNVQLITLSRGTSSPVTGELFGSEEKQNLIRGLDVSEHRTVAEKAAGLIEGEVKTIEQAQQLKNPDSRITLTTEEDISLLSRYADGLVGLQTSDDPRFVIAFWEVANKDCEIWEFLQATPDVFEQYAGQSWIVRWEQGQGVLLSLPSAYPTKGLKAIGKQGIAIHRMRQLFPYHYSKERFHQNIAVILAEAKSTLPAIWCFCSSPEYSEAVRQIDQSLKVTNATLVKVPFDLAYWQKVADEKYPNGLPQPYSNDPTQWIFHGHPCGSVIWDETLKWTGEGAIRTDETVLQVAVARLLGYRWPAELDPDMELAAEQRQWVDRCEALHAYADEDGIVCIPPVRGEGLASDRLLNLLAAAYGENWSNAILGELLKSVGHGGKTLETWLRDQFFSQHCKLFQHRPFIWHIWDGLRDGFAALVNYHKLDGKLLETLIYTYLGDWIQRQKQDQTNGIDGAEEKIAAAEVLKKRLELILEGEKPYDIFVPLAQQPLGWNPDLNDGVRLNIRPFLSVPDVGKKGAGVLRDKPNIQWNKDRGKDVPSAPWYHLGLESGGSEGDRINDHHLSLEEKQRARGNF